MRDVCLLVWYISHMYTRAHTYAYTHQCLYRLKKVSDGTWRKEGMKEGGKRKHIYIYIIYMILYVYIYRYIYICISDYSLPSGSQETPAVVGTQEVPSPVASPPAV